MEIEEEIEIKNPEMQGEFKIKPEIEIKTNKWNVNTETCYLICVIENNALQKRHRIYDNVNYTLYKFYVETYEELLDYLYSQKYAFLIENYRICLNKPLVTPTSPYTFRFLDFMDEISNIKNYRKYQEYNDSVKKYISVMGHIEKMEKEKILFYDCSGQIFPLFLGFFKEKKENNQKFLSLDFTNCYNIEKQFKDVFYTFPNNESREINMYSILEGKPICKD
jgi:hypothetical protein